ncbi:Domain of uncharacterised function (DUF2825) [Salmonella enterica subsp. enterica]|uniref:Domain of uncharacterized function (DUF2825) n=1 Tax=Salmonella enterica I TaxID=59201 RepID=A0A3S4HMV9_SALET|nr:Domain of uncharacterised function (DUF2825) [Salmonella enterica subsp. enterica]
MPCGLSPLARGTLKIATDEEIKRRFIPAGAGNTDLKLNIHVIPPVYPRWRGEHNMQNHQQRARPGLSPLARGTHVLPQHQRCNCRFIPAGAGNTLISTCKPWDSRFIPAGAGNTSVR